MNRFPDGFLKSFLRGLKVSCFLHRKPYQETRKHFANSSVNPGDPWFPGEETFPRQETLGFLPGFLGRVGT